MAARFVLCFLAIFANCLAMPAPPDVSDGAKDTLWSTQRHLQVSVFQMEALCRYRNQVRIDLLRSRHNKHGHTALTTDHGLEGLTYEEILAILGNYLKGR